MITYRNKGGERAIFKTNDFTDLLSKSLLFGSSEIRKHYPVLIETRTAIKEALQQ